MRALVLKSKRSNETLPHTYLDFHHSGICFSLLFIKIKALTNQTPKNFVKSIRLKRAAQLLKQRKLRVTEVAFAVGFQNPRYFSKCFQKEFEQTPTEYMNSTI